MATFEGILYIALLIIFAKLFEELMVRIKQPPIIGYIAAGIILGPAVLGWVIPTAEISLFIAIGVFFLFFLIGLEEIDVPSIFSVLRHRIFAGAGVGFLIPFSIAAVVLITTFTDQGMTQNLAIASVIGISSLGVVAKVLMDYGKLKEPLGLEIFTLTAVLEFIGIIIASVFIQLSGPSSFSDTLLVPIDGQPVGDQTAPTSQLDILSFVWLFVRIVIFFAAVTLFGLKALPRIIRFVSAHLKVREIYFGIMVGIILLVAYFAELSGIHGAIGVLLLGVLLSQMPKQEYDETVKSMHGISYGVFIPIFFAGIGLYFSFGFLNMPYYVIGLILAVITFGKFGGAIMAAMISKLKPVLTVSVGVMSKGTVDLAIMLSLLSAAIVQPDLFSLLIFGTVIMILISSIALKRRMLLPSATADAVMKILPAELASEALIPLYARTALYGLKVGDVYNKSTSLVEREVTVEQLMKKYTGLKPEPMLIVTLDKDRRYYGLISWNTIASASRFGHHSTQVGDIAMRNIAPIYPEENVYDAIEYMALHDLPLLAVVSKENYRVLGGLVKTELVRQYVTTQDHKS
jgi:Kef-type K+ transport system membrane component KefB